MFKTDKSSNIDHLDYNAETNTLEVKFKNGGIYHYSNVDKKTYDAFEKAESHGKHFAKYINGKFQHKKQPEKKEK